MFLDCNGFSSEGARVLAEIGFITLSCWCHSLFPGRERKVQAKQQWRRMTDRHYRCVTVFMTERVENMLMHTSVCKTLTFMQHPSENSAHIPSRYSHLSGSDHRAYAGRLQHESKSVYNSVCEATYNMQPRHISPIIPHSIPKQLLCVCTMIHVVSIHLSDRFKCYLT